MTQISTVAPSGEDATVRRNAILLAVASAFAGAVPGINIAVSGLAGSYLLGADKSLATLPITFYVIGSAVGAIPAATIMSRVGRRAGFMMGSVSTIVGGLVAGYAVLVASFAVLLAGLAAVGLGNAFAAQYRFAAADSGSPAFRARAISWVLSGGVVAAVIGPQTVIMTRNLLDPIPFAGSLFAISAIGVMMFAVLSLLGGDARVATSRVERRGGRPLLTIVAQPRFVVSLVCAIGAYGLMSLLMTAAPLAMVACGLGEDNAALGIQWHAMAMFGPSFVTGQLIARFGVERIIAAGMALLTLCAVIALSGIDVMHFWLALILLGLGWNFAFIGATAMLTETYLPEEKGRVQGLNDFLVFAAVAVASFSSGKLFVTVGWEWLNWFAFPIVAVCGVALVVAVVGKRRVTA